MAEVRIGHAFVSAKPDSLDSSIVSSSEWNADEVFKNGADGQIPIRDAGQITGARWTQGAAVYSGNGTASGVTTTGAFAPVNVTFTSTAFLVIMVYVVATTSAGQIMGITLRRDGATLALPNWSGDGVGGVSFIGIYAEAPGGHAYDVICAVGSGTITTVSVTLTALVLGV